MSRVGHHRDSYYWLGKAAMVVIHRPSREYRGVETFFFRRKYILYYIYMGTGQGDPSPPFREARIIMMEKEKTPINCVIISGCIL